MDIIKINPRDFKPIETRLLEERLLKIGTEARVVVQLGIMDMYIPRGKIYSLGRRTQDGYIPITFDIKERHEVRPYFIHTTEFGDPYPFWIVEEGEAKDIVYVTQNLYGLLKEDDNLVENSERFKDVERLDIPVNEDWTVRPISVIKQGFDPRI